MFIMDNELKLNEWQFAQRKYLPFEEKLILSRRRIEDWYDFHEGDVYVSFSGGMDSTVLVDLVRKTVGDVPLVFVNTGLEYPEIVRFVSLLSDGELRETQAANYFSNLYPIDCAVLSVNAQSCRKYGTLPEHEFLPGI